MSTIDLKGKKIALSGSFSTGKSTIADYLISEGYPIISETSRRILEMIGKPIESLSMGEVENFQREIIDLQILEEKNLFNGFITDTSLLDNLAYSTTLSNYKELQNLVDLHHQKYDLIFYFPIIENLGVKDDGIRHTSNEYQKEIDENIRSLYKDYGYNIITVPLCKGTKEEQIKTKTKFILKELKKILSN